MNTLLKSIFFAAAFTSAISASAQDQKLPATWNHGFVISLNYDNSMGQAHTDIRITYDSCIYETQNRDGHKKKMTLMTEAERKAILKKLHELKVDKIKSNHEMAPVHDGWSESICLDSHCIEGGSSAEMNDNDKNNFLDAYRYLEEFAENKKK